MATSEPTSCLHSWIAMGPSDANGNVIYSCSGCGNWKSVAQDGKTIDYVVKTPDPVPDVEESQSQEVDQDAVYTIGVDTPNGGGGGGGGGGLAIFITNTATNFIVTAEGGSGGAGGQGGIDFMGQAGGRVENPPVDCKHSFRPTDDPKSAKCFECSAIWPAKAAWLESIHPDVRLIMCRSCKDWTGAMMSVTVWVEFRNLTCDECGFCEDRTVKVDGERVVDQPRRNLVL